MRHPLSTSDSPPNAPQAPGRAPRSAALRASGTTDEPPQRCPGAEDQPPEASLGRGGGVEAKTAPAREAEERVPRVLSIASSDSGGGAGIQADIKAFARCGAHGMTAIAALTAQNTQGVTAIHELPPAFVRAQIDAVLDDIGADAAKTGMLFSAALIEAVAQALEPRHLPLVVDPVMVASSGSRLLREDAVETLVTRLFPLATVITPNLHEAQALSGIMTEDRAVLAERLAAMGAPAVLVTGGHGADPVDHLFDGSAHLSIPVARYRVAATHGAGCTHSATLAAGLAAGLPMAEAARQAAWVACDAVAHGLTALGGGDGPVHALHQVPAMHEVATR